MTTLVDLGPRERVAVTSDAGGLWLVYQRPHWTIPDLWIWAGEPVRICSRDELLEYCAPGLLGRVLLTCWEDVMQARRQVARAILWHAPEATA